MPLEAPVITHTVRDQITGILPFFPDFLTAERIYPVTVCLRRPVAGIERNRGDNPVFERRLSVEFIVFLLVGLVVGVIARLLMPGPDPIGILGTIIVGCVGALIGGYLWTAVFGQNEGVAWIGSILMAMALLFLYRRFTGTRSSGRTVV
jgi:uncharacterized membrane protein YeaQ/YmgE (transglycosylase-associated protein family)